MSDVFVGGVIVFFEVGVSVWFKKGIVVFWYNLFVSGEGDYSIWYVVCLVLVGNKWVFNKWFYECG